MRLFALDDRREILVVNSDDGGAIFAAIRFEALARQSIANQGFFTVALSGGSTPKKLYEQLLLPNRAYKINWSKVKIFWSDERVVPPDHPDSNYGMAMHYFSKEPLDEAVKFRMPVDEKDLNKAALHYENKIKKECFDGRFDLVLLGMGEDGHTASLFPHTKALKITDRLVAPNYVPQKNTWRMTFTYPCINDSRKVIIMAYGKAKGEVLRKVFAADAKPEDYPTAKIGKGDAPALFIIDEAAANELAKPNP
jgi:6-phosphogluconolactonase